MGATLDRQKKTKPPVSVTDSFKCPPRRGKTILIYTKNVHADHLFK